MCAKTRVWQEISFGWLQEMCGPFLFQLCGRSAAGFFQFPRAPVIKWLLFPFRIVLSLITGTLQHTEWTVSQPSFVSIASGQLPNGQDMTFIGLCGRWFPIPQEFPGVTGGASQNGEEETR